MIIFNHSNPAYAAGTFCDDGSGFLPIPTSAAITSNMGVRNLQQTQPTNPECSGQTFSAINGASKNHKGTDYATACGQKIDGPPAGCVKVGKSTAGGYGNVAQFDCGAGVKIQYAHIQSYNAESNVVTTGDTGVGGCHLDYIVTVDGTPIDAQCVTGTPTGQHSYGCRSTIHGKKCPFNSPVNICDKANQQKMKEHSEEVFGSAPKYNVPDGETGGDTAPTGSETSTGETGGIIVQGTGDTPGSTPTDEPLPPIEEPQPDPEEDDPVEPDPVDPYDPKASTPICDNSTCITQDNIDNAKHKHVTRTDANAHWEFLTHKGDCKQPTKTGATVFRQIPGDIADYNDAFCTNQGCVYVNDGSGEGSCE